MITILAFLNVLEILFNISSSIDFRDINLLPLDASSYDESNGLCFVLLRSLADKLTRLKIYKMISIFTKSLLIHFIRLFVLRCNLMNL